MSQYALPKFARYIPLRERILPRYPLWFRDGPQLRLLMPLFWMKLTNATDKKKLPPNQVQFEVHPQMTRYDVKNYLEKIYKVPVDYVTTFNVRGKEHQHPENGSLLRRDPDKKFAEVWLGDDQTFEFPSFFAEKESPEGKATKDFMKMTKEMEKQRQKAWKQSDVPEWFR